MTNTTFTSHCTGSSACIMSYIFISDVFLLGVEEMILVKTAQTSFRLSLFITKA